MRNFRQMERAFFLVAFVVLMMVIGLFLGRNAHEFVLSYYGYCFEQKRWVPNEELIQRAVGYYIYGNR